MDNIQKRPPIHKNRKTPAPDSNPVNSSGDNEDDSRNNVHINAELTGDLAHGTPPEEQIEQETPLNETAKNQSMYTAHGTPPEDQIEHEIPLNKTTINQSMSTAHGTPSIDQIVQQNPLNGTSTNQYVDNEDENEYGYTEAATFRTYFGTQEQIEQKKPFIESTIKHSLNRTSSAANNNQVGKMVSIGLGVTLAVLACIVITFPNSSSTVSTLPPKKYCSYEELRQRHPQQREFVWQSLSTGIENILNKRTDSPGVYLFVHEGGNDVLKLVRDIALETATCFGKKMEPVEMEIDEFTSMSAVNDYGNAIERYKMKIRKGRVIVIANLNEIPAESARALHTICDTHSPIVKEVVIFLTLVIPKISENPLASAEDALVELWGSKLKRSELDPLITRVTDQVIALQSENLL